jgi:hypothetical protein
MADLFLSHDAACNPSTRSFSVRARSHSPRFVFALTAPFLVLICTILLQGCASVSSVALSASSQSAGAALNPSSASIQTWQTLQFSVTGSASTSDCTWTSSQPSVLASLGGGQFQGTQTGSANVSVTCGSSTASANVVVSAQQQSAPITITKGGTYSGNWVSNDPSTPAITIKTSDPVVLQDSVLSSRGTLIRIAGSGSGANVTVQNVTATALDPQVSGSQRGAFISATSVAALVVRNCSVTGASFGVKLSSSQPSTLQILNNSAANLEDRASDGNGSFLASRPALGHFVLFDGVTAPNGAEIAWNKIVQSIGDTSIEDVINLYNSQGAAAHPITVHDNYMEGASSPVYTSHYTGTALITDGPTSSGAQPTAYVVFENNQVVATAGTGVGIAAGHDIQATGNRVVSCGVTSSGSWYAWGANAVVIWNYYKSAAFYNNTITATSGGMVGPGSGSSATAYDLWVNSADASDPGISAAGNTFTDPCLTSGSINLQAEEDERTFWTQKVAAAAELIGDQHQN